MNSVRKELWLARLAVMLLIDCVAAYLLSRALAPDDSWGFLWALLGLWAFQFVAGVYRFIQSLASALATRGIVFRGMSVEFMDAKLKRPVGLTDNPAQLLASIADDPDVDLPQRMSAAVYSGAVDAAASTQGIILGLIYRGIVTKALMALPRPY